MTDAPDSETSAPQAVRAADEAPTAAFLIVGNEVLAGRTRDANLQHLAEKLTERGIHLVEARVVRDLPEAITPAVRELSAAVDYLFTSGGIGPTHDDITADCVAAAFGRAIDIDPEARRRLEAHYADGPQTLNEARLRMARIPEGARLIDNPVSAAPGFVLENVYVMAGVPRIMQAMLDGVLPTLTGGRPIVSRTIRSGLAEGTAAEGLGRIAAEHPAVDIGSYPRFAPGGGFSLSIVVRGADPSVVEAATDAVEALVRSHGQMPERVDAAPTDS